MSPTILHEAKMRLRKMAIAGLALFGLLGIPAAQAQEETAPAADSPIEAALALSRQTGAPILAIAGSET